MSAGNNAVPPPSPQMAAAMSGAVDLAAVKARSDAAARAAQAPPPTASSAVVSVTEASFQAEVLDRSFQVPVLIDVRSERSEASQQLSPLLELLATEAAGTWVLASIEIDANPRIAQALQVEGIPTVFAVIGGQLVPGFSGALPEDQVREFIAAVLQAGEGANLTGPGQPPAADDAEAAEVVEEPSDPRFADAEDALQSGDYDLAAQRYQAILDVEPANTEAALALRQTGFLARVEAVPADAVAAAAAAPADVAAQLAAADAEFAANEVDASFQRLLALIRTLPSAERDPIRDRLVEYFDLLGAEDPRVPAARRTLANALF
ncbi:MAG: tetratricopeptide repeat protein [Jatrophihabitans sp.]